MQIWVLTTNDFISVYWVAFKLFDDIWEIIDFINKNIEVEKLRRFDLAIDVPFKLIDIHKNFKKLYEQTWLKRKNETICNQCFSYLQ